MTAADFLSRILVPDLAWLHSLLPSIPASESGVALLLAIAGQESNWSDVAQAGSGDALGPWQMQRNTCADILTNRATDAKAIVVCATLKVTPNASAVFDALLANSRLASAFARLDLWSDPAPLPVVGDKQGAWDYYDRVWKPGVARPEAWSAVYEATLAAMKTEGLIT